MKIQGLFFNQDADLPGGGDAGSSSQGTLEHLDDSDLDFDGDGSSAPPAGAAAAATPLAPESDGDADFDIDEVYTPESEAAAAAAAAAAATPDDVIKSVYSKISEKLGVEKPIQSEEELIDAIVNHRANAALDLNEDAINITQMLEMDDEDFVREVLDSNREQFAIYSQSDIDMRISAYKANNEFDKVVSSMRGNYTAQLQDIKNEIRQKELDAVNSRQNTEKENAELTEAIRTKADEFSHPLIDEKSLPGIRADLKEFLLSGKYASAVLGADTLKQTPEKAIENALWVNPRTREFMLRQMILKSEKVGASKFIKEHLYGKATKAGTAAVASPSQKRYSTDAEDLDI